jgi:hypothetical protein
VGVDAVFSLLPTGDSAAWTAEYFRTAAVAALSPAVAEARAQHKNTPRKQTAPQVNRNAHDNGCIV